MIVSVLLSGLAVAVLLARSYPAARLAVLVPRPERSKGGFPSHIEWSGPLAAGLVLGVIVGGTKGVLLGLLVGVIGPRIVARVGREEDDSAALERELPLALDLLGACLVGGGILRDSLFTVAAAFPGPCGLRLMRVSSALEVGIAADDAFAELGNDKGVAGSAARALSRATAGGLPVAAAVGRVAEEQRARAALEARKRAQRAGVMAMAPLGACFLPAFIVLGIVPTIYGLLAPMFSSF